MKISATLIGLAMLAKTWSVDGRVGKYATKSDGISADDKHRRMEDALEEAMPNPFFGMDSVGEGRLEVDAGNVFEVDCDMDESPEPHPGVQLISTAELTDMEVLPTTGFFLLDAECVPSGLEDILSSNKMMLEENGTLFDEAGEEIFVLVRLQIFEAKSGRRKLPGDTPSSGPVHQDRSGHYIKFFNSITIRPRDLCFTYATVQTLVQSFVIDYDDPRIRVPKPLDAINTQAAMNGAIYGATDSCVNCDTEWSRVEKNFACFSEGLTSAWHQAGYRNGLISFSSTWWWTKWTK